MNNRMKASFWTYLLGSLILGVFGSTYIFRSQFMPYHAVEVGMPWDQVPQGFQIMITSLMKALGGAQLSTFVAIWAILLVPFRKGERWAKYILPIIALVNIVPALYGALYARANTTAEPPWVLLVISLVIVTVGFLLSLSKE